MKFEAADRLWTGLMTDDSMDIADWRKKIDEIDQKLVEILNQRAQAAQEIGRLKRKLRCRSTSPIASVSCLRKCRRQPGAAAASASDPDL